MENILNGDSKMFSRSEWNIYSMGIRSSEQYEKQSKAE